VICCLMASVTALASSASLPEAVDERAKAIARHKPSTCKAPAVALFQFLMVDLQRPLSQLTISQSCKKHRNHWAGHRTTANALRGGPLMR
jgi:hypothetical protein